MRDELRVAARLLVVGLLLGGVSGSVVLAQSQGSDFPPKAQKAMTRGMAAAEQQEWDLAIKYFSEARKAAPTWPSAQFNLALAYDSAGGRELNAIAWYRAYLASAPNAANAQQVRAQIVKLEAERH